MANELVVPIADSEFGPAMRRLTERERKFVVAWYLLGGNQSRAYVAAGYAAPNRNTIDANASAVAHRPKVLAAIKEYAHSRLGSMVPLALSAMEEILRDPGHKDRAKVIQMVTDRTGLHATTEHKVTVEHTDDREEKLRRLAALAKANGVDPRRLLGGISDVIDTDFKVVDDADGRDGLEDLLS